MSEFGKKGYKAFDYGMKCLGKQYAENTVFEEQGAEGCCKAGVMHYCENPLDVLSHYLLIDDECRVVEIAEVEPLAEVLRKEDKCATKKLRIGAKLSFKDYIKASIDFVLEKRKGEVDNGNYAQLAASGNCAQLAASGNSAQLATSGRYTQLAASGNSAQLVASGYSARLASSGSCAQLAASGNAAQLAASGNYACLAASGNYARLAASGNYAQLAASGNYARLASSGKNSVVAAIGAESRVKGVLGNWLVLAEWAQVNEDYIPLCVKSVQVDGEKIKADTWYKLVDGEFVEA